MSDEEPKQEEREDTAGADEQPQPWAKATASTESLAADDEEDDAEDSAAGDPIVG